MSLINSHAPLVSRARDTLIFFFPPARIFRNFLKVKLLSKIQCFGTILRFPPQTRRDIEKNHTNFASRIRQNPLQGGSYGLKCRFYGNFLIKYRITKLPNNQIFKKLSKNRSEPIIRRSFSRRIRICSPNRPKSDPGPHFKDFYFINIFFLLLWGA